jgi:hypothetical protein
MPHVHPFHILNECAGECSTYTDLDEAALKMEEARRMAKEG